MADRNERELAPVGRWSPFSELDFFRGLEPWGRHPGLGRLFADVLGEGQPAARGFAPAVDVAENDDEYIVSAELPGAKREDVTVELHDGVLTLRGEKKGERQEEKNQARYVERTFGSFSRSFTLPGNADAEKMAASFQDGVLTIRIPKREEAKPRVINIQSS